MPIPFPSALCQPFQITRNLCIRMPGGMVECSSLPSLVPLPTGPDRVKALLAQVNASLAPYAPIFQAVGIFAQLADCMTALTEFATIPPGDPTKFVNCVPGLIQAINQILSYIPPLNIPILVADVLDVLIVYLQGIASEIAPFLLRLQALAQARIVANSPTRPNISLQAIIDCAQANLDLQWQSLSNETEPLDALISMVNALIKMFMPRGRDGDIQIPLLGKIMGEAGVPNAPQQILGALQQVITTLTTLRNMIPISPIATIQQLAAG